MPESLVLYCNDVEYYTITYIGQDTCTIILCSIPIGPISDVVYVEGDIYDGWAEAINMKHEEYGQKH